MESPKSSAPAGSEISRDVYVTIVVFGISRIVTGSYKQALIIATAHGLAHATAPLVMALVDTI